MFFRQTKCFFILTLKCFFKKHFPQVVKKGEGATLSGSEIRISPIRKSLPMHLGSLKRGEQRAFNGPKIIVKLPRTAKCQHQTWRKRKISTHYFLSRVWQGGAFFRPEMRLFVSLHGITCDMQYPWIVQLRTAEHITTARLLPMVCTSYPIASERFTEEFTVQSSAKPLDTVLWGFW